MELVERLRNIVAIWPPSSRRYYRYTLDKITESADEIERLRAEVAKAGRRYADSESRLALCDAALQDMQRERDVAFSMSRCECSADECCKNIVKQMRQAESAESALAALRKRVDEAPTVEVSGGHLYGGWVESAVPSTLCGKRVALVVLES